MLFFGKPFYDIMQPNKTTNKTRGKRMKKLLNISVIAALAVLPMAANAATGDIVTVATPATATSQNQTDNNVTATTAPKYALAVEAATDATNVATASYVKGAYNQAMKAINKVSETANSAVKGVQVNGTDLQLDANGKANVTVAEGATNGTVAVNGSDVAVHGLGTAAYSATTDYISSTAGSVQTANIGDGQVTKAKLEQTVQDSLDAADSALQAADITTGATNGTIDVDGTEVAVAGLGSAAYADTTDFDAAGAATGVQTAIEGKLDDGATGYDIDAKTLKVQGADVLTGAALTDYAKKTGVTQTITNSTIAGTVPTVTVWGSETTGTAAITASITGATYAEPANP